MQFWDSSQRRFEGRTFQDGKLHGVTPVEQIPASGLQGKAPVIVICEDLREKPGLAPGQGFAVHRAPLRGDKLGWVYSSDLEQMRLHLLQHPILRSDSRIDWSRSDFRQIEIFVSATLSPRKPLMVADFGIWLDRGFDNAHQNFEHRIERVMAKRRELLESSRTHSAGGSSRCLTAVHLAY